MLEFATLQYFKKAIKTCNYWTNFRNSDHSDFVAPFACPRSIACMCVNERLSFSSRHITLCVCILCLYIGIDLDYTTAIHKFLKEGK